MEKVPSFLGTLCIRCHPLFMHKFTKVQALFTYLQYKNSISFIFKIQVFDSQTLWYESAN
jgi:hypothetical protein